MTDRCQNHIQIAPLTTHLLSLARPNGQKQQAVPLHSNALLSDQSSDTPGRKQSNYVQDNTRHTSHHSGRNNGIHRSTPSCRHQDFSGGQGPQRRTSTRSDRDEECIEGICELERRLGRLWWWIWRVWYGRRNAFETVSMPR